LPNAALKNQNPVALGAARTRAFVALGAALALAGCDLTWEKPEASLTPPERFREARPKPAPSIHSARAFVERFGSKELTRIVDEALENNYDIAAAAARILEADAQARVSSAPLFPTLNNVNTFQRTQVPSTAEVSSSGAATSSSSSSTSATT